MKASSTPEQKTAFEKKWSELIMEIKNSFQNDPNSEIGIHLGERFMSLINGLYGKKYAHLRTKKFEKGFGEGKGLSEIGCTPEIIDWIGKAVNAYYEKRIHDVLSQLGKIPPSELLDLWNAILDDMYGEDSSRKKALLDKVMKDDKISEKTKKWLEGLS